MASRITPCCSRQNNLRSVAEPIRLLLVEDNQVFREALELLLGLRSDVEVVASAGDGTDAVPLCREHHHELHRHGNEMAWWANLQIAPMETARELWAATLLEADPASDRQTTEVAKRQPGLKIDPANDAESV